MGNRQIDRLLENLDRELRALEVASRAVQVATKHETAAREAVHRARVALDEERAREQRELKQSKARHPADAGLVSHQAGTPSKHKNRHASIALLQSRGLWKPNPIETAHEPRHRLVKDEQPTAPLAQLSHDDARDLWNS